MIYKVEHNPSYENVKNMFAKYKVDLPENFLKGNEIYVSLFINENINDIVIGRTFKVNAKSKMSIFQSESMFIEGGWYKC